MTMENGRIAQWVANDGDQVQAEQVVLILETEKVAHEIAAPISGILAILGKAGDEYPCGTVVGVVAETAQEYEAVKKNPAAYAASAEAGASSDEAEALEQKDLPVEIPIQVQIGARERIKISPLARKLAQIRELDISVLTGSGPEGRIIKRDIVQALEAREQKKVITEPAPVARPVSVPVPAEVCAGKRVRAVIPLTGMRKTIADHLHQSTSSTARVSAMLEFDVTELVKLRSHYVSKATEGCSDHQLEHRR
jgi:pyruvate/2-oxoglutarate dehydrogenase complex dihydrolipoamide acyltransferase (E2) component